MAPMTNLRILYRMYDTPKIHYNLYSKGISYEPCYRAVLRLKLDQNVCPGDLRAMNMRARERVNNFVSSIRCTYHFLCPCSKCSHLPHTAIFLLFLPVRPNYIHSTSNYIHTDGPTARARARARG